MHADGQKIAKKLPTSISKETKRAKQLLVEYNEACSEHHHQSPTSLLEILSPSSESELGDSISSSDVVSPVVI